MSERNDIAGIVLPFLPQHVRRILYDDKRVIAKFISRIPRKPESFRLKKGMKVVFYVSASRRKLAGEGTIVSVEFLLPQELTTRYGRQLWLSSAELSKYIVSQPDRGTDKPLLVLKLSRIRTYPDGTSYPKSISMVGEYIPQQVYESIFSESGLRAA